jgi:metallo-beta-lactamase family protein
MTGRTAIGGAAPRVSFLGAARTVTGSCYLLDYAGGQVLIDCGLFQGSKSLKALNYDAFPFDPAELGAVLVTHAHIDHSGLLPKLVRDGYRGRILTTVGSRDLLTYMLPDSGYIQESEVVQLNRRRRQRGEAAVVPIYTRAIAEATLGQIDAVPFGEWLAPVAGLRARFWNAGHILGAASIELEIAGKPGDDPVRMMFSGDLGGTDSSLHQPPDGPTGLDYVVVESTYGNRDHPQLTSEQRRENLAEEISTALAAGGNLIIPVFAVERTQELLLDLGRLFATGRLPRSPVFLDSPLAIRATEVFGDHAGELGQAAAIADPFGGKIFHFTEDVEDSKKLNLIRSGAIIMAASGMCDAGRIRHHLKNNLWRSEATVLLVGYQAPGTLGQLLLSGVPAVRIQGEEVRVRARIRHLETYSAHADRSELLRWVTSRMPIRSAILVTHGEPESIAGLQAMLREHLSDPPPILAPPLDSYLALDRAAPVLQQSGARLLEEGVARHDWHNDYASFLLDLGERLRSAPNEATRRTLLHRLSEALRLPA